MHEDQTPFINADSASTSRQARPQQDGNPCPIFIVDPDFRRRAALAQAFHGRGIVAHPLEAVAELPRRRLKAGLILIADTDGMIPALKYHFNAARWSLPFLAYGPEDDLFWIVDVIRPVSVADLELYARHDPLYSLDPSWPSEPARLASMSLHSMLGRTEECRMTSREAEVSNALNAGLCLDEVAQMLGISTKTVQSHLANIRRKLTFSATPSGYDAGHLRLVSNGRSASCMAEQHAEQGHPSAHSEAAPAEAGLVTAGQSIASPRFANLTRRERQVLTCVAAGMSSKVVAIQLDIRPKTVETHRTNILAKLGARNMTQAVRMLSDAQAREH